MSAEFSLARSNELKHGNKGTNAPGGPSNVLSFKREHARVHETAVDLMNESDDGLMVRVKRGDHKAFRILADRYRTRIFRFIFRMLHNDEVAEDLTQETFLRVFKRANTYKPGSNFSIWLYTIAKNLTFNRVRDEKRQPLGVADSVDERGWDLATTDPGPDPLEMSQREG